MKILLINGGYESEADPSTAVIDLYEEVLKELNVEVSRMDLYKKMPSMPGFHMFLEDIQGVVLVTTAKWVGIGAKMQEFLDKCYEAGKDMFRGKYCLAVALALESGEDYALTHLIKSWTVLSGLPPETLSGVIPQGEGIKNNKIRQILEKKIEDFYRIVQAKRGYLPSSLNHTKTLVTINEDRRSSIQQPVSPIQDDIHNPDILEITKIFKKKLNKYEETPSLSIIKKELEQAYMPTEQGNGVTYAFHVQDIKSYDFTLTLEEQIIIEEKSSNSANVEITLDEKQLFNILDGKVSMQNAFVLGKITAKGQIALLNVFDECFQLL